MVKIKDVIFSPNSESKLINANNHLVLTLILLNLLKLLELTSQSLGKLFWIFPTKNLLKRFLIDTCEDISLFPSNLSDKHS